MPVDPTETPLRAVREFHYALSQALHDVRHERAGMTIEHYWDSDSIHLPVRGMLDFTSNVPGAEVKRFERQRLVQALFGAGYLGAVKLLPAHRAEFMSEVSRWMRERLDHSLINSRIEQAFATPTARALTAIVGRTHGGAPRAASSVSRTLNELATLDSEAFVLVESAWGTWPERLQALLAGGSLSLDDSGHFIDDDDGELLSDFARQIQRVRGGERSIATAVDAAAFVALSKKVEAARGKDAKVYPRFFTSSPQLRQLWRSSDHGHLQQAFRIRDLSANPGEIAADFIWRGANYYYLRASNPALRIGASLTPNDISTLNDLETLSRELGLALASGRKSVSDLIEHYPLEGDRQLSDAVDNFRSFRMVDIWLGYEGRRDIDGALESLQKLADFGATPLVAATKKALEGESLAELRREIQERDLSLRMLDAVYEESSAHERIKGRGALSLNEDLGAVRWGLEYSGAADSVTLQPAAAGHYTDVIELYDVEKLKASDAAAERAAAVLLGLEEFALARRLIDVIGDRPRGEVLTLMSFVASISQPGFQSERVLEQQLGLIRAWWRGLSERSKGRLVLGYGYALFKLWEYSARNGQWPGVRKADDSIAAESLETVKTYLGRSLRGEWNEVSDLRLANGVNHMVYVAFSAELVDDQTLEYVAELERVAVRMDNYRFLDTVGIALLWQAKHVVGTGEVADHLRESLATRALDHLNRAVELVASDDEVAGHRDDAAAYLLKVRGFRNSP